MGRFGWKLHLGERVVFGKENCTWERELCQVLRTALRFWRVGPCKGLERMPGDHM